MKILHIITGLNNAGAEGVLYRLVLNDKRNKHIVISLIDLGYFGSNLINNQVEVHELNFKKYSINIFGLLKINKIIKESNPDIIQSWMYHSDLVISIIKIFFRIKIPIFWNVRNSNIPFKITNLKLIIIIRICSILSYFIPAKIISCAKSIQKVHLNIGYKNNFTIIPNGYDTELFKFSYKKRNTLRKFLKLDKIFTIGMVARWHPQKNHIFLLELLNKLKKNKIKKWKVVFIGKNMDLNNQKFNNLIKKYNISDHCLLLGERYNLKNLYNIFDISICCSLYGEGFQNIIAESMSMEVPVISFDVGDAKNILKDIEVTVPIGNKDQMYNLLLNYYKNFFNNSLINDSIGQKARNKIILKYSISKMIMNYNNIWKI